MNKKVLIAVFALTGLGLISFVVRRPLPLSLQNPTGKRCTLEAKICPDGTSVGRSGPSCEFAPCPSSESIEINLASITPASGSVGERILIKGTGFTAKDNVIKFGIGYIYNPTLANETTLEFSIPDGHELCAPGQQACPGAYPRMQPGIHEVQVLNNNGESNILQFEII